MKVAIPTRGDVVDGHFGHCEVYTIFTLDHERKIHQKETLPSPQGCGCKSNIAAILREKGVSVMLAGNMGDGAYNVLRYHGIDVYRGCSGDINKVVEDYARNMIYDSKLGCDHHGHHGHEGHGGGCNH